MKTMWKLAGCLSFLFVLAVAALPAQAQDDDEIRAILKLLQHRLAQSDGANENGGGAPSDRVTEIGSSRRPTKVVVEEEEKQVVRIYDLSDLFTIAPPYIATQTSDLKSSTTNTLTGYSAADPAMFPTPGVQPTSGGGMGGGLSGVGGGGVFNIPSESGTRSPQGAFPKRVLPQVGGFGLTHGDAEGNFGGARISFDDLIDAIISTIEPDQWEDVGGEASIQSLGNALIVRCTPSTHEQVDNLLNLLRQKWGTLRTISVEAWWLWMSDTAVETMLADGRPKGENANVFGAVNNADFADRLQELAKDEEGRPGYRAKITCYNGQTVHTVSGGQRLFVTDLVPMLDGKTIGYRPVVSLVEEGAALQVRPHATQKGTYAAIDIHTRVNVLADREEEKEPAAPQGKKAAEGPNSEAVAAVAAIDRPRLNSARLSTSMRLPIDQVMLIGGMSFDAQPSAGGKNLYLFVKLSMQELRDDQPEDRADELP